MAFVTIPVASIDIGDPITKELFDTIKANEDDLDSRVTALSIGSASIDVFDDTIINATSASTLTGLGFYRAKQAFVLTGCEISTFEHGALTGTLQCDIKKNTSYSDTGMSSVFTTLPSIAMAAADFSVSTNQVFNGASINIAIGDCLRFDVTSMPTNGVLGKFRIQLYGEVT